MIDESMLWNWVKAEHKDKMLAPVPDDVDEQLVAFFKDGVDSGAKELFNEIYKLRESKILNDAAYKAEGYSTIIMNFSMREKKLHHELVGALVDARRAIFPFLKLPAQPANPHCLIEFTPEWLAEEERKANAAPPIDLSKMAEDKASKWEDIE